VLILAGAGAAWWFVWGPGNGQTAGVDPDFEAAVAAAAARGLSTEPRDRSPRRTPGPGLPDMPGGVSAEGDGVKISTFLGNETRRFYGLGPPPKQLELIWSTSIGTGKTSDDGHPNKPFVWSGTGWTGQPALVRDKGKLYLLVGGYDHNLHKIDAATGRVLWEHDWGDVIKGSPSVFQNPQPQGDDDRYIALAGSRRGFPLSFGDPSIAPYRAVTWGTGKELWRLPVPLTSSYSRDCDGSGFYLDGRQYIGVESGWFYILDPLATEDWNGYRTPKIVKQRLLAGDARAASHGGNLVLESSPALLDDVIYVASGAGHVYGMRRGDLKVVFDFYTGSDLDGSAVTTRSGRLLVAVEKQYIAGHGGILMLDPSKPANHSVVWFFPTEDRKFQDWEGGVIGSAGVNDEYDPKGEKPRLAAFGAVDGNLYVVAQDALASGKVPGPNGEGSYATPQLVFKTNIGGSISTPIMVDDTIVAAGYDAKVHLYRVSYAPAQEGAAGALQSPDGRWWKVGVHETAAFSGGSFESTPIMWQGRVYIGSRDGSFYCLGDP
jgi:outer membrane protein assembly factor BamB